jgi:tetratricopeptide (TPR) repeat protein
MAEASLLLNQLATEDSAGFLDVVDGLSRLAEKQNDVLAYELGLLQIKALDLLQARGVADVDARRLDLVRARALMTTAKYFDAIALLKNILKQSPQDQSVLTQLAAAWEGTGQSKSWAEAVGIWRRIASLNKPGSAAWCEARYHVARISMKMGKTDEAEKLLKVTRLLYPTLGTPEIRDRFTELANQFEAAKVGSP